MEQDVKATVTLVVVEEHPRTGNKISAGGSCFHLPGKDASATIAALRACGFEPVDRVALAFDEPDDTDDG